MYISCGLDKFTRTNVLNPFISVKILQKGAGHIVARVYLQGFLQVGIGCLETTHLEARTSSVYVVLRITCRKVFNRPSELDVSPLVILLIKALRTQSIMSQRQPGPYHCCVLATTIALSV